MTKQITLSTTAVEIFAEDASRTAVSVQNNDTSISVYVGKTPAVSSTTGYLLLPGAEFNLSKGRGDNTQQRRWAVAASGTPVISIDEEYGEA